MANDRELLKEAQETIQEQSAILERLSQAALQYGTVIGRDGKRLVLANGASTIAVEDDGSKIGDCVLVIPQTQQILEKGTHQPFGLVVDIAAVHETGAEVLLRGETQLVSCGSHKIKKNDRVVLDSSGSVILTVLESKPPYEPKVEKVTWDDIGGQEEAKKLLIEAVELPRKYPKVFAHYGKKPTNGILLYGAPGNGKTLLGKAVATSIGSSAGGFIGVKGPEILDPYVGVAEANVRSLFRRAEDYKLTHKTEAVIFIDEAEAILAKRGGIHSYMEKTIVPTFLTEMDGLEQSSAIVILATNRPELLDPAVIRDGRIDYKIKVGRPTQQDAIHIMTVHVGKKPIRGHRKTVIEQAVMHLYSHNLKHSGAMIAGLVEKASARAIARDISGGSLTGICQEDFVHALETVKEQESYAS